MDEELDDLEQRLRCARPVPPPDAVRTAIARRIAHAQLADPASVGHRAGRIAELLAMLAACIVVALILKSPRPAAPVVSRTTESGNVERVHRAPAVPLGMANGIDFELSEAEFDRLLERQSERFLPFGDAGRPRPPSVMDEVPL